MLASVGPGCRSGMVGPTRVEGGKHGKKAGLLQVVVLLLPLLILYHPNPDDDWELSLYCLNLVLLHSKC